MRIIKTSLLSLLFSVYACLVLPSFVFAEDLKKSDSPVGKTVSGSAPAPATGSAGAPAVVSTAATDKAVEKAAADKEEQSSYVYDLKKLIEKSKENIKRVNEKIQEQAIYKRNQQREEKAREYYERAIQLFEEGKANEARDLWEKSIKITEHPEMKMYIKGSEKRFKVQADALKKEGRERQARTVEEQRAREQQVSEAYATAVTLYKQKKYKPSRDEFMLVEQLIPEYKATRSYLKLLEQNIAVQDREDLKNQQKEIARQQEDAESARVREKEMWRKEIELKEQERRSKLMQQAKDVYKQAMDLYNKKDFVGAKEKFQEVEWVVPDYKLTRKYLEKLDADIQKHESEFMVQKQKERDQQRWEEELVHKKQEALNKKQFEQKTADQKRQDMQQAEISYQSGVKLVGDKKYQEARDQFLDVQKIYPDYKATASYLSRLNDKLGIIENAPQAVSDDVKEIYADAVKAYKAKDFAVAKLKFERVEFMYPNYESTRRYMAKLDKNYDIKKAVKSSKDAVMAEQARAKSFDSAVAKSPLDVEVESGIKADMKPPMSKEYDQLVLKAEPMYAEALKLYEDKKFDESFKQFQAIENLLPNYKSTRPYLKRVNQQIKKTEQQRYKEEQIQQAETINLLAKQASTLFQKIQQLSDDSATSSAKKKFELVDRLFANMSREQAKLLAEILEEEKKLKLEEVAYEQEVQKSEFANMIDPIYDEAVRLYQAKQYDAAKAKFLEAQAKLSDYRSSSRYLALIEKQNQLLAQVMKDREDRIKDYQAKADRDAKLAAKIQMQAKEQGMIRELVAQAESINDQIMNLSKDRNFEEIKAKFAELEKVVDNLLTIKNSVAERERVEKYGAVVAARKAAKVSGDKNATQEVSTEVSADAENAAALKRLTANAGKPVVTKQGKVAEKKRFRDMDKQNRDLYRQAQRDYDDGRYSEAKVKFVSLEQQPGYSKASRKYINTIDQIALKKQTKVLNKQQRDREEFIKGRIERERMSYQVKEAGISDRVADRARAKALAEASPDAYPLARNEYSDSLNLRGRRPVEPQVSGEQQISEITEKQPGLSPNEDASSVKRREQKELSDKRRKFLDDQYKAEQKQKEEQARKEKEEQEKQEAMLRAKTAEVKRPLPPLDKAGRRQQARELKQRAIYDRELRRAKDSGMDRAIAAADLQEKADDQAAIRREQEMLRQQRQQELAERREKERKISTMISQNADVEGGPKTDLSELRVANKSSRNPAPQLAQKSSVPPPGIMDSGRPPAEALRMEKADMRKQFENGVDDIYREALSYYKSGMYKEARDKFSDVEDLYPDYKRTRNYMERTDAEILKDQKRRSRNRDEKPLTAASRETASAVSGKQDAVSSALDMFESQAK